MDVASLVINLLFNDPSKIKFKIWMSLKEKGQITIMINRIL